MVAYRSAQPKSPELDPKEIAALREMSKQREIQDFMLRRLKKLGLAEQKPEGWAITDQGVIVLMFAAAR